MNKTIIHSLLLIIAVIIEFFRDYCFININIHLHYISQQKNGREIINYTDSFIENITSNFSYDQIINIKWILAILFSFLFYILGLLYAKIIWNKSIFHSFIKFYTISWFFISVLSLAFYFISKFLNLENQYNFYYISIELGHFIQSIIFPLCFILAFYGFSKMKIGAKY